MIKFLTFFLALLLAASVHAAPPGAKTVPQAGAKPVGPVVPVEHSHYAVLVDAVTGHVLWARNADAERPIASTTKMLTAILLIERGHMDDIVTAPKGVEKLPDSSLHLTPGEKLTLHDLLYAMLLRSANDTAVTGAVYLSGSVPAFAQQMNLKAKEIGAMHSHFVTPNGLPAPGHYSTAADLAKIACYALNNLPQFNEIVKTQTYQIHRSVHVHDEWVKNTATTFLKTYPGADGVKTGYVHEAGHCFVGSATRNNWRLVAVALDSNSCREDVMSLLDYGFDDFAPTVVVHKNDPVGTINIPSAAAPVSVAALGDVFIVEPKFKPFPKYTVQLTPLPLLPAAPITAGTKLGTFSVLVGGQVQATGDAVAAADVAVKPIVAALRTGQAAGRFLLRGLGALLGVAMLFFLGVMIYARTTAKGARRRRDRLAPGLRGVDSAGQSAGQRPSGHGTRDKGRPRNRPGDL